MADSYRIIAVNNDLYWFIRNSEYLLFQYETGQFTLKERIPFSLFENPSNEDRGNIYIDEKGNSYFCLNGGFAFYSPAHSLMDKQRNAYPLTVNTAFAYNRYNSEYYYLPPAEDNTSSKEVLL
ncbi:MAG: hypothetical protein LIP01_08475, partial [Tannerellaceae bacterium]|nr:hypothetical protein [Tannerellaceae bacterium]